MAVPDSVRSAFLHVKRFHPELERVTFYQEDSECGGVWLYQNADGSSPQFGPEIDVSLLESAIDEAWEDRRFPAVYTAAEMESDFPTDCRSIERY